MAGKRDKPEEIVVKLRQVEVLQSQGMSVADAVRQIGGEPLSPPLVRGQWRASRPTIVGDGFMGAWVGSNSGG